MRVLVCALSLATVSALASAPGMACPSPHASFSAPVSERNGSKPAIDSEIDYIIAANVLSVSSDEILSNLSQAQIAAQTTASLMAIEAELATDADRGAELVISGETLERQADVPASDLAAEAELAPDAHRAEFAASTWTLLLDHEGESLTFLPTSTHLSDEYASDEPVDLSFVEADAPVRRFFVEDEDIATLSTVYTQADSEVTGAISLAHREADPEWALNGYEDR